MRKKRHLPLYCSILLFLIASTGLPFSQGHFFSSPSFAFDSEETDTLADSEITSEEESFTDSDTDTTVREIPPPPAWVEKEKTQTHTIAVTLKKEDVLSDILHQQGIPREETNAALLKLKTAYQSSQLIDGQEIYITYSVDFKDQSALVSLESLHFIASPYRTIEIHREIGTPGEFVATYNDKPLKKHILRASGTIDSSLFATATDIGLPYPLMQKIIKAYSYDVDFQRDLRKGDKIEVLFERYYTDNKEVFRDGDIIFASLSLSGKPLNIYLHRNADNETEFYTEEGKTVKKSLLRTPVNGAQLTSGFGMRRHPVLGYSKMHQGIDFAAPTGTPILAAGRGVIEELGTNGSYGNYIRIQHSNEYSSAYAHILRFANNLKKGSRVKQGQVIAYIGSTGRSTGPHLHYEIIKNGQRTDPSTVKFPARSKLDGKELAKFTAYRDSINNLIASLTPQENVQLALRKEESPLPPTGY